MNKRAATIILIVLAIVAGVVVTRTREAAPMLVEEILPHLYSVEDRGFSIRLPDGYVADETYRYEALGPDKEIAGVKFTIPASRAEGTNLSSDSYLSVEQIPNMESCSADLFAWQDTAPMTTSEAGTMYSVASVTGAAAGNSYEETVYALSGTNPCTAVRYFVHYGVLENYPEGAVRQFDRDTLLDEFDAIRRSLIVVP